MERLIIFGGTFDPIHRGHLRIARKASMFLNADVAFVPAKIPRWKEPEASSSDRLEMLKLAIQEDGSSSFFIDDCELKREGEVTYSLDTLEYFKKKYPSRELFLLIGADEVNKFPYWHEPEKICKLAKVIYSNRPDIDIDKNILNKYKIVSLNFYESGTVSSSSIRKLQSADVPMSVLNYIEANNLYYMKRLHSYLRDKRLNHSLSVAHLAYSIAISNKIVNPDRAYIAGALHDVGKELSKEEDASIMEKAFPEYKEYPEFAHHQFTGSYIAETEFGIKDVSILDAIKYHCTGKAHMSTLAKIIFASDKIEPTRGYDSSKLIKDCKEDYYVGFLHVIKENAKFLSEKGGMGTTELSNECYGEYLAKEENKNEKDAL